MDTIKLLMQLKNGNPDTIFDNMMHTNPNFKKFVDENKGKSSEQIASEHGIDINSLKNLMR